MRPLQGEPLLQAWEAGANQGYLGRAVTLLHMACPEIEPDDLLGLTVPQLNLQLLRVQQVSFGSTLSGFLSCPQCAARLELSVPVTSLIEQLQPLTLSDGLRWSEGTVEYTLRPLAARDLILAEGEGNPEQTRKLLLQRCITAAGDKTGSEGLDHSAIALKKFDELHAGAEITLQLECPTCLVSQSVDLDIARFLWSEVRHAAIRLLREVHDLAGGYGWSEQAILNMTVQRRSAYLELIRA